MSLWLSHRVRLASCEQESVPCDGRDHSVLRALSNLWLWVGASLTLLCSVSQTPGTELHQIHPCRSLHPVQEAEANVSFPWGEASPHVFSLGDNMSGVVGTLLRRQAVSCSAWTVQCQAWEALLSAGGKGQKCCIQVVRRMGLGTSELRASPSRAKYNDLGGRWRLAGLLSPGFGAVDLKQEFQGRRDSGTVPFCSTVTNIPTTMHALSERPLRARSCARICGGHGELKRSLLPWSIFEWENTAHELDERSKLASARK